VFLVGLILSMLGFGINMGLNWTPLQCHYFPAYVSSSGLTGKGNYLLLAALYPNGWRIASNQDVVRATFSNGQAPRFPFALSSQARLAGAKTLAWRNYPQLDNATAYEWLRSQVYENETPWEMARWPVTLGSVFIVALVLGVGWRDRKGRVATQEGHILRGPG
jgi:hypothetical protein